MEDFAEAEIIRIINKSAKLNEANLRGCLFNSQRAVFLQPQRFCGHEPVVWISIEALPQTVNVQCKFLGISICYWMLSDSCPRRAHTQQFMKQKRATISRSVYMMPCIHVFYVNCCMSSFARYLSCVLVGSVSGYRYLLHHATFHPNLQQLGMLISNNEDTDRQ